MSDEPIDVSERSPAADAALPVLPLSAGVVLPGMVVTIALETEEARAAAEVGTDRLLLVPRIDGRFASVGTVATVEDRGELRGGLRALVVRGVERAVIGTGVPGRGDALWVSVEPAVETRRDTETARELAREYRAVVEALLEARGVPGLADALRGVDDPGAMADMAGYSPDLDAARKVQVLESLDVEDRLRMVIGWTRETLAEITLKERIRSDVAEGLERNQREFLLRQQLAAIRRELGEEDADDEDLDAVRALAEDPEIPEHVRDAVGRELRRLERTPEQSPEHGWIRAWLDTIAEVPWTKRAPGEVDVAAARGILDADHHGLDDVKERIVEHLAVRARLAERGQRDGSEGHDESAGRRGGGAIIALVGPPGVGKTSLGESVARAMGRPFVRVALGGVRDEAEIRGHRRTYVGAAAGRIARAVIEAGVMNPVMLLDEVDKLGSDWRGDPSSALLEVLDPAQNHTFRDHYLEVDLDLSDVVFLATANVVETIPAPLLDRMEVVTLDGYTEAEKVAIASRHLLPRQRARNGIDDDEVVVSDEAIGVVVRDHTREAGVRSLERALGRLLRKAATALSTGEVEAPVVVEGEEDVRRWLGRPRRHDDTLPRTSVPGVATGLAVTGAGGDVLSVEATSMPGKDDGELFLTGQLGDVMRESGSIALSYVRSHAADVGVDDAAFQRRRFHLHVPAGAVPKDGPSAGVTMVSAIVSLLTGRPVRSTVGMTGEVTLQGQVLPVGGIKQKVLAAHRAGLREVVLPARNEADLEDVPQSVLDELHVHLADHVGDVIAVALEPQPLLAAS